MKAKRRPQTLISETIRIFPCFVRLTRIDHLIDEMGATTRQALQKKVVNKAGRPRGRPALRGGIASGNSAQKTRFQIQEKPLKSSPTKSSPKLQQQPQSPPKMPPKQQQQRTRTPVEKGSAKPKENETEVSSPMVNQTLGKRMPKPNRRYINDSVVLRKADLSEGTGSSDESEREEVDDSEEEGFMWMDDVSAATKKRGELLPQTPLSKSAEPVKKKIMMSAPKLGGPLKQRASSLPQQQEQQQSQEKKKIDAHTVLGNALYKRKLELDSSAGKVGLKRKLGPMNIKMIPKIIPDRIDIDSDEDGFIAKKARKSDSPQLAAKRSALSATLKQKLVNSSPSTSAGGTTPKFQMKNPATLKLTTKGTPILTQLKKRESQASPSRPSLSTTGSTSKTPVEYATLRKMQSPLNAKASPKGPPVNVDDLEDFEQMPTFTIVNVSDIMKQKDDSSIMVKTKRKSTPTAKKVGIPIQNDDDDVDYRPGADTSDEEDDDVNDSDEDDEPNNSKGSNRRKTQHTKILSEKIKANMVKTKALNTSTTKTIVQAKPTTNKPYRNIIGAKNGKFRESKSPQEATSTKPVPRILNSTLCRNVENTNLQPVISAKPKQFNNNNNHVLNRSKDVLKTYNADHHKANLTAKHKLQTQPKTTVTTHQVTASGNRRIRKITCFETWFVIKLPPIEQPSMQKTTLDLSLVKLGNDIKQVELPSDNWSYKIMLQRIRANADASDEAYTGEVQDPAISENDKHLYQPINIMFRRSCSNKTLRMQFDRAVIFKNNTFFVNVDGKNIRLVGAPMSVQDFSEIETLLKIVDDITLVNPYVEQTTYVI